MSTCGKYQSGGGKRRKRGKRGTKRSKMKRRQRGGTGESGDFLPRVKEPRLARDSSSAVRRARAAAKRAEEPAAAATPKAPEMDNNDLKTKASDWNASEEGRNWLSSDDSKNLFVELNEEAVKGWVEKNFSNEDKDKQAEISNFCLANPHMCPMAMATEGGFGGGKRRKSKKKNGLTRLKKTMKKSAKKMMKRLKKSLSSVTSSARKASRKSKKRSTKKTKRKGKKKMNAYMLALNKARKSNAPSFVYNGKTYVQTQTKTGMVIYASK